MRWGAEDRRVHPTPSVAIKHGACPCCLGGGETLDVVLGKVGKCSWCGGSGKLDDIAGWVPE